MDDTASNSEMDVVSDCGSTTAALGSNNQIQCRLDSLQQENNVLKTEISTQNSRLNALLEENRNLRANSVNIQVIAEQEEEYISNTLMKQISTLKKEKERLAINYEHEEEYLTNELTRKLQQLQQEKIMLEETLEREQEVQVKKLNNRIQKLENDVKTKQSSLDTLKHEKIELENTLEQEQEALVNRLWKKMERLEAEKRNLKNRLDATSPPGSSSSIGLMEGDMSATNEILLLPENNRVLRSRSRQSRSSNAKESSTMATTDSDFELKYNKCSKSDNVEDRPVPLNDDKMNTEALSQYIHELRSTVTTLRKHLHFMSTQEYPAQMNELRKEEAAVEKENINLRRRLFEEKRRRRELSRNFSESESSIDVDHEERSLMTDGYYRAGSSSSSRLGNLPIPPRPPSTGSLKQCTSLYCRECGQVILRPGTLNANNISTMALAGSSSSSCCNTQSTNSNNNNNNNKVSSSFIIPAAPLSTNNNTITS